MTIMQVIDKIARLWNYINADFFTLETMQKSSKNTNVPLLLYPCVQVQWKSMYAYDTEYARISWPSDQ